MQPSPTRPQRWPLAAGIIAGVAADALLGDPRRGHPVAAFGRAATAIEDRLHADSRLRGGGYTAICVALATAPALAANRLSRGRPWLALTATAIATWTVTGARSLTREAERVRQALTNGDLAAARAALPSLCGRDPRLLTDQEISRAVIESVAENSGDAIVSPLLWGSMGGITGLAVYRAVNTLDAMVGHRSRRYARFGWASARLDDVANWAPARLTALLAAGCAPLVGGQPARTWRTARTYGPQHPSPNAGWCEAAFAGALDLRLGGSLCYEGVAQHRPELGDGRVPEAPDIARAVRLSRAVTAASAGLTAVAALALTSRARPRRRADRS
jgi:adenosylcobinamide-phosphate synthase